MARRGSRHLRPVRRRGVHGGALLAKQKGCNAFYAGLDDNSNVALATALHAARVKPKVMVFPTGYEPSIIGSPAWHAVQGGYFDTTFRPFQIPNAGTQQMKSALMKYAHFSSSEFPSFSSTSHGSAPTS